MGRNGVSAIAALVLATCVAPAFAETPQSDAKPSSDVGWIVIGIQPATARMEVDEPWMKSGRIWNFHYNLSSYRPDDGFIIVKAKPGKTYGIAASSLMFGKSIFGTRYKPCGQVPTFQADAGKVVYITTISYRKDGSTSNGLEIDMSEAANYSQDIDGARTFLKAHYPGLSDSLEQGSYQMTPVAHKCPARDG